MAAIAVLAIVTGALSVAYLAVQLGRFLQLGIRYYQRELGVQRRQRDGKSDSEILFRQQAPPPGHPGIT